MELLISRPLFNHTPTAGGAVHSPGCGRNLSSDVKCVANECRCCMPDIGAHRGVDADLDAPAPRESMGRQLHTVSSCGSQPPAEEPRTAGAQAGDSHGAKSLEQAHEYLRELAGNRRGALTTLVAQLNGHDRHALDHLALTVHALHLTVDGASHAKAFAGIGEALASFLAAAARPRAKSGDLCTESNKDYRKLCGTVRSLCDTLRSQMTTKGFAAAMLRCALERSDAAAGALVSKRLGGKLDSDVSDVRKSGMVNRHAGDAQLRLAERALDAALGAKYVTNFIEKFGTMLEKIGSTDQLMNGVLLKQPATDPGTDPGGPRAPGGEPAAPQGGPAPGAATQPAAPAVFNNHNENNVNLNLDGLGKPFDEFVRMMGALLTRMDAFDPSRVQRPSDTDGPAHGPTGVRATVVKSPPSFVQTLNVAPADASTEPPVDPQQSSSAMVVRSVGTDAPPKAGELEKMPTGAWRLDGSAWKMVRANPIVRTTEGPRRIDPFSGVGAHVMRGAGVDGVPPGAGSHLAKTDPSVATGASSADASTEVDGNRHGGQQSGLQTALQTDGLEAGSQTESRQVSADRSHRDAQVQTASEPPVDPQQSSPAMADRSVGTAEPPKVDELENKQVGGWQRIRREIDGKIRYEWVKDGENPFVRTTDGPHRMNERSNIGWPKSGVGSRPANTDSIDKGAK